MKKAQSELEKIDPSLLAQDLEKQLEEAMFAQAAKETEATRQPEKATNSLISQEEAQEIYKEVMGK